MTAPRLAAARAHCDACALKEQQIRDLRLVIQKLQTEARRRLGPKACALIDALEGGKRLTPRELAKATKQKPQIARSLPQALAKRGIVRRCGWRDVPGKAWPEPEFEIVGLREAPASSNGAALSRTS